MTFIYLDYALSVNMHFFSCGNTVLDDSLLLQSPLGAVMFSMECAPYFLSKMPKKKKKGNSETQVVPKVYIKTWIPLYIK